jgi:hypothetical protein
MTSSFLNNTCHSCQLPGVSHDPSRDPLAILPIIVFIIPRYPLNAFDDTLIIKAPHICRFSDTFAYSRMQLHCYSLANDDVIMMLSVVTTQSQLGCVSRHLHRHLLKNLRVPREDLINQEIRSSSPMC